MAAGFRVDVRMDVNAAIRRNADLQEQLLRAAARAVNAAAADVRSAAIDEIAARNREFKKHTVKGYVTVSKAKFSKQSVRKDGSLRVNYGGIRAKVIAAGKAPNLIYFVPPAARFPAAWRGGAGVSAHVAGKTSVYNGSFIVKTRTGKMVVVSRSAAAKAYPIGMRYKSDDGKWKWKPKWSKGLYGPPLSALAGNQNTYDVMAMTARAKWPVYWKRESENAFHGASK